MGGLAAARRFLSLSLTIKQDARALDNLKKLDMRTDQDREPASGTLPLLAAAPWHISASLDFHLCRHFLSLSLLLQVIIWNNLIASALWGDHFSDALGWHKEGLENMALKYVNKASQPQPKVSKSQTQTSDAHALNLLGACYLPGVLAAYLQLARWSI